MLTLILIFYIINLLVLINLENILINKEILTVKFYDYFFKNIQEPKMWLNNIEKVLGLKKRGDSLNDKIA